MDLSRIKTPKERIVETDIIATAYNRDRLGASMRRRYVKLACGHHAITSNASAMVCARCTEMLRRSISTGKEDYESFRHGSKIDRMAWPDDPCRALNEDRETQGLDADD